MEAKLQSQTQVMFATPMIKTTHALVYRYECAACGKAVGIEDGATVTKLVLGQQLHVKRCPNPECKTHAGEGDYAVCESALAPGPKHDPRTEAMIEEFKSQIRTAVARAAVVRGFVAGLEEEKRVIANMPKAADAVMAEESDG